MRRNCSTYGLFCRPKYWLKKALRSRGSHLGQQVEVVAVGGGAGEAALAARLMPPRRPAGSSVAAHMARMGSTNQASIKSCARGEMACSWPVSEKLVRSTASVPNSMVNTSTVPRPAPYPDSAAASTR